MKHRAAILSATAMIGMIVVTGCFSQRGNTIESGQANINGSGGAHLVQASWTPNAVSWNSGRTGEIKDPALGETAYTTTIPSGWRFVGTILRPGGCYRPAVAADGLSYTVLAPDGYTAVGQLPGSSWSSTSNGNSSSGGPGAQGQKCEPVTIDSAAGFLLNIAVPNMHPNATKVTLVPPTPQMQSNLERMRREAAQSPTYGMQSRRFIDTGRVRVEYMAGSQPMDEILFALLDCQETTTPAYPALHRPARTDRHCSVHGIPFKRAPKGELDALLASNPTGPKIDQAWDQHIQQKMMDAFAQYQKASNAQFAAIQKHFSDVTANMIANGRQFQAQQQNSFEHAMANDRANQDAIDHAAHLSVLDSLNRQDFIDPTTGQKIETSNQFTHNWISSDKNSVVLGADPTFDPNGAVDPIRESWTELIPAD
jgi:hypothetical protein